jgi:hypothetical protein
MDRNSEISTREMVLEPTPKPERGDRFSLREPSYLDQQPLQRWDTHSAEQGLYLAASGTLTQFNAIVAAVLGTALASSDSTLFKAVATAALALHVIAAFLLCWAGRPQSATKPTGQDDSHVRYRSVQDTFRNYRRGWRATLVAMAVSSIAAGLFVMHSFGLAAAVWR